MNFTTEKLIEKYILEVRTRSITKQTVEFILTKLIML